MESNIKGVCPDIKEVFPGLPHFAIRKTIIDFLIGQARLVTRSSYVRVPIGQSRYCLEDVVGKFFGV
jgi:hypothetical protein